MSNTKGLAPYKIITLGTVFVTLIGTPNINKDALIIPKVSSLFLIALFILPYLLKELFRTKRDILIKSLRVIVFIIFIHLFLVILFSDAPIEQQLFGRTGRGLGAITLFSIFLLFTASAIFISHKNLRFLVASLAFTGLFSLIYAISQSFGFDFAPWDSRTNGVIGTLGNPNFVSSFTSIVFLPTLVYVWERFSDQFIKILILILVSSLLVLSIYRAESTQGYVTIFLAIMSFLLIKMYYKFKFLFYIIFVLTLFGIVLIFVSFLDKGPLANYLYKVSIQSRNEFWQSALATANSSPVFGVGLDSFGDYSMKFRKTAIVNEYTDSAHNYFLDYAATAGYIFMILNLLLVIITFYSFYQVQKKIGRFDKTIASLYSSYLVFIAQALISPISIPIYLWGSLISGSVIGLASNIDSDNFLNINDIKVKFKFSSIWAVIIGLIVLQPYFSADRLQLKAMNTGNGDLAIKSAKMYPESVVRYFALTRALMDSGLNQPALSLAYSAVEFNPNSPALWALILTNPLAPISDREKAKLKIIELDPLNKEVINYKLR